MPLPQSLAGHRLVVPQKGLRHLLMRSARWSSCPHAPHPSAKLPTKSRRSQSHYYILHVSFSRAHFRLFSVLSFASFEKKSYSNIYIVANNYFLYESLAICEQHIRTCVSTYLALIFLIQMNICIKQNSTLLLVNVSIRLSLGRDLAKMCWWVCVTMVPSRLISMGHDLPSLL